jgi:hypothetical protein
MISSNDITWISSTSKDRFDAYYKYSIQTWDKLPGKKILFVSESLSKNIEDIEILNFWNIVNPNQQWLSKSRPNKAHRFWFKGYTIYYALQKKFSKYVIWIDADVFVNKNVPIDLITTNNFALSIMDFESNIGTKLVETGLQIFNTEHNEINAYAKDYINYWNSEQIFNLPKPYDNYVTTDLVKNFKYNSLCTKGKIKKFGENSFLYTNFKGYLNHFIGKGNKKKLEYAAWSKKK